MEGKPPVDPAPSLQEGGGQEVAVPADLGWRTPPSLVSRVPCVPPPYLADEVDAEEDLPRGLQGPTAWLLAVELARAAGQDEEAADDGDGPGVHPHLRRGHRHLPGPPGVRVG